ncbi:hypothetical protein POX_e06447 [Penicillium oxalicum]|uniref:Uncharacterized protein n=1 Tax=Penicillium oxalicum (strain 114-2 / CGMCC 5302) TaxID=933388 RepID=S8AZP3_PENO1|nr:hypothetical protein POX_e06447 [Penicillium oxalicum]EPS27482.1 hypothetical protein PDE_02425 [Penicillium oxalicum 114-2]KAI2788431.1 hypothetical protein POX_e06447 [Penicillium oxalicum]
MTCSALSRIGDDSSYYVIIYATGLRALIGLFMAVQWLASCILFTILFPNFFSMVMYTAHLCHPTYSAREAVARQRIWYKGLRMSILRQTSQVWSPSKLGPFF